MKSEWGTKRECSNCGVRYYDLQRSRISCPKCDAVFEPPPTKGKVRVTSEVTDATETSHQSAKAEESARTPSDSSESDAMEVVAIGADENAAVDDEALIEDTSELGEDEDDMAAAIEEKPMKETE